MIDPDQLARDGLTPLQAGKAAANMTRNLLRQGVSFIRESTLTSKFDFRVMREAKMQGYWLELIYIQLASVNLAIQRVRERHERGGHDVAECDIVRRYQRSLDNLPEAIKLADMTTLLDNSLHVYIQTS